MAQQGTPCPTLSSPQAARCSCLCSLPTPCLMFLPPWSRAAQGISPITRDFVNPEKAWPHLQRLAAATAATGRALLPRLPIYPAYLQEQQLVPARPPTPRPAAGMQEQQQQHRQQQQQAEAGPHRLWLDAASGRDSPLAATLRLADAEGLARGSTWFAGAAEGAGEGGAPSAVELSLGVPSGSGEPGHSTQQAPGRGQQNTAAGPALAQQQDAPGAARQLRSSLPAVRRRSAARAWRVAVAEDGLLEGCPGPEEASPEVRPDSQAPPPPPQACSAA